MATHSSKSFCIYGNDCHRKNPDHFKEYSHPPELLKKRSLEENSDNFGDPGNDTKKKTKFSPKIILDNLCDNCHGFFLTKIVKPTPNANVYSISLKEILDECNGQLIESIHFNFVFDLEWLINQYPPSYRDRPIYIVYGKKKKQFDEISAQSRPFKQLVLCPTEINDAYGVHHTKMIILRYSTGIRIIIHTANLIQSDWDYKTQGLWVSKTLPKLVSDDFSNDFQNDLIEYLSYYSNLDKWKSELKKHDFSSIKVCLIASTPGSHCNEKRSSFGHLKLRKFLRGSFGPTKRMITWPIVAQFSSIGSLGMTAQQWLTGQFLSSLSAVYDDDVNLVKPDFKCIFPTVENVRCSLEGYAAGVSLPYSKSVSSRQPYLNAYFHRWEASISQRQEASPHIKTYCRISPDYKEISWFLLTSANLSKAAWGELKQQGSKLFIRSFELGVLFLPKLLIDQDSFKVGVTGYKSFPVPYNLPLTPYGPKDKPWIWDEDYTDLPDSKGNMWVNPKSSPNF